MLICTTRPPKTHVWPAKLTVFKKTPPDLPLDDFDGYNADHNGSAEGVTVFLSHDPQHLIFTYFFLNTCKYIPMFCPVWRICIWNVYFVCYKAKSHISGEAKRPGVSVGRFHHRFYCHSLWKPAKNKSFLLTHFLKINLLMASISASDILWLKCC